MFSEFCVAGCCANSAEHGDCDRMAELDSPFYNGGDRVQIGLVTSRKIVARGLLG
jgi:hypothetical protein